MNGRNQENFIMQVLKFWNESVGSDLACFVLWNDHAPSKAWFSNDKNITWLKLAKIRDAEANKDPSIGELHAGAILLFTPPSAALEGKPKEVPAQE